MNNPFTGLSNAELEHLLNRTLLFTVWLLRRRGRARYHPDLDPEDLVYRVNESEPYSGWVKSMLRSGVKGGLYRYKDGKLDGLMTQWHENGQKKEEETYKDGKKDGLDTVWYENGQKSVEATYKDGKLDGLQTTWHVNGQKSEEATYKEGKED